MPDRPLPPPSSPHILPFGAIDVFALSGERARYNLKNVSSSVASLLLALDNFERRFSYLPPFLPSLALLPRFCRFSCDFLPSRVVDVRGGCSLGGNGVTGRVGG